MIATSPNPERIKYRKLRIAFSVGCGVLCLLLIVLWVRSYTYVEQVLCTVNDTYVFVSSLPGVSGFSILSEEYVYPWIVYRMPTKEWLESRDAKELDEMWGGFYVRLKNGPTLMAPYWFLSLVAATFAVAPWAHRLKRFSLQALLAVMTLVAAFLGLLFWASK